MRQGAYAELQAEAVVLEPFVLHEDLVDDLLRRAHEIGAIGRGAGVELGAGGRGPATLLADAVHGFAVGRIGEVARILAVGRDEAMRADADRQGLGVATDLGGRLAVEIDERRELARLAANNGNHQGQAIIGSAGHRVGRATDGDPERDGLLYRHGIEGNARDGLGVLAAGPGDGATFAQLEQQFELFLEQGVVVVEIKSEEREALDEGPATSHDLGAAIAEIVQRRELLVDADRIFRAQHGDGGGETDRLGARGGGGQDGDRRRGGIVGAVMFAQAVEGQAELVGQLDLLKQIAQAFGRALQGTAVQRIGSVFSERIKSEFHGDPLVGSHMDAGDGGIKNAQWCNCAFRGQLPGQTLVAEGV